MCAARTLCIISLLAASPASAGNWICTVSYHGAVMVSDFRMAANVRTIEQASMFALGFAPRVRDTTRTVVCR